MTYLGKPGVDQGFVCDGYKFIPQQAARFALQFDGVGDIVDIGVQSEYQFIDSDSYSISVWLRMTATLKTVIGNFTTSFVGWEFLVEGSGFVAFQAAANGANAASRNSTQTVNDGDWHNVVMTYDGSASNTGIRIYIDGGADEATSGVDTFSGSMLSTDDTLIGRRNNNTLDFDGAMHNVAIWDKELTASEANAVYGGGRPPNLSSLSTSGNLIGWWGMDDPAETVTITDKSVSNNDGTVVGNPVYVFR